VEGLSPEIREEGQWIVLMGFLVSIGIFFLALILSQSTIVGQTTAEGVLEFPKNDIQDVRAEILDITKAKSTGTITSAGQELNIYDDMENLTRQRKSALVAYDIGDWDPGAGNRIVTIHYNNGVFDYNEIANVRY
jgi:hypothetical protein